MSASHPTLRLALLLSAALLPASAQSHPAPRFSDIGSTVSVASLRISPKAWEHFTNAKLAHNLNHEADFHRECALALALEPNFANLYLLRAGHELRIHQFEAALADVLAAQHIEPRIQPAGTILAGIYNGLHRFDDALLTLQTLPGTEASTWQAVYESTRAYLGRHDIDQALRASTLTLKLAPESCHEALLLRANALSLAHRRIEAIEHFRLFLASNPAPALAAQVQTAIDTLTHVSGTEVASN